MEAGRRFIQDVQRLPRLRAGQLGGQLHALGFATRQRRGRLAQREIIQANRGQRGQRGADLGDVVEQFQSLADGHVQHVRDRPAAIGDRQGLAVVTLPLADFALDPHVGQEVHFDALLAVPLAGLAASPRAIEAEPRGTITPDLGFGQMSKQFPDLIEDPGISGGVRGRGAAQRLLIDLDDLVDLIETHDLFKRPGLCLCPMQTAGDGLGQSFLNQRTLARSRDARDDGQRSQRNPQIDIPQVVHAGTQQLEPSAAGCVLQSGGVEQPPLLLPRGRLGTHPPGFRNGDFFTARQILAGQ